MKNAKSSANCCHLISGWMVPQVLEETLQSPICRLTFATQLTALRVLALTRCERHANSGWESSRRTRLAVTNRRAKTASVHRAHGYPIKKIFSETSRWSSCCCCWCFLSTEFAELQRRILLRRFLFLSLPSVNWLLWLLPSWVTAPEQTVGQAA